MSQFRRVAGASLAVLFSFGAFAQPASASDLAVRVTVDRKAAADFAKTAADTTVTFRLYTDAACSFAIDGATSSSPLTDLDPIERIKTEKLTGDTTPSPKEVWKLGGFIGGIDETTLVQYGYVFATATLDNGTAILASSCQRQVFTFGGTPPTCGDGVRNGSEACEGADLHGETCASVGAIPAGTLACTGSCTFDTSGCACLGGGALIGNGCWYLGAEAANCDSTCAGVGLAYSELTASYAGSGGSESQCFAILDALGITDPPYNSIGDYTGPPVGCVLDAGVDVRVRFNDQPTTAAASGYQLRRACACQ